MDQPLSHHADDAAGALPAPALRGSRGARVFLPLTLAGAALGCLSLLPATPVLIWNFTESVPVGLYAIDRHTPHKGDLVAVAPTGDTRKILDAYDVLPPGHMLLKQLAAAPGDTVCRNTTTLTINSAVAAIARSRAHDGRALPAWSGCRTLLPGEVLLLAPHPASFDGRYFGAADDSQIIGVAHPIVTLPASQESQ